MTLTIHNVEQGTAEWDDLRRGMLTASVLGTLITPKTIQPASNDKTRSIIYQLVAERITGYTEPLYASADMEDGHVEEPLARDVYSEHYAPATEVGFMVRNFGTFEIGYSPDGVVGDDGLIEVKSRAQKKHLATIIARQIPGENMAQIQCGLLVSGRAWCDYISYCGGMRLYVKRVLPDPRWRDAILEVASTFEVTAETMTDEYHANTAGMPATERIPALEEMRF